VTDAELIQQLLDGDEAAFSALVTRYHSTMLRVARGYVRPDSAAEEVVQETWVAILKGLDRFQGRSSLRTWMFRILTNRAKTRGTRESRTAPFSSFSTEDGADPVRFDERGMWKTPPEDWGFTPERMISNRQLMDRLQVAIDALPERQRQVVTLRDVRGWSSEEVCNAMEISETNQRVLLHRARTKLRAALEVQMKEPVR
jgi:RNA polymerase sigma-70 factor (ECF subfamily)